MYLHYKNEHTNRIYLRLAPLSWSSCSYLMNFPLMRWIAAFLPDAPWLICRPGSVPRWFGTSNQDCGSCSQRRCSEWFLVAQFPVVCSRHQRVGWHSASSLAKQEVWWLVIIFMWERHILQPRHGYGDSTWLRPREIPQRCLALVSYHWQRTSLG
jgi:hypothetical protein